MPLDQPQQEHLVALYLTAKELTEEIEATAIAGIIRDGSGRLTTPLPEREWSVLARHLAQIREVLRRVAQQHAGNLLPEREERTPVNRTRAWIDARLDELEEVLQDLEPKGMARRVGVADRAVRESLEAAASGALTSLWDLRRDLEREAVEEGRAAQDERR